MKQPNKSKSLYIDLPEHVHRSAKAAAALEGRQLGDVVTDAILAYVASRFPNLGADPGSPRPLGSPENPKNPTEPKPPKPPKSPPAKSRPGSQAHVPVVDGEAVDVSDELPPASPDENPFADEGD